MKEIKDAEVVESRALTVAPPMNVNDVVNQVRLVQQVMGKVMQQGQHYGTVPGCGDKKVLLQPGAQKLCMTFRLCPAYEIIETNLDGAHKEFRVTCTLTSMGNAAFVGQGVGICSTMESKYRWRKAERKCPECGAAAIIKGSAQYGGGWVCWKKKGGCGFKFDDEDATITNQSDERTENPDPADCYNTVLKMAKKRAFVDATITATAASDIFTQDVGDDGEVVDNEPAASQSSKPAQPVNGLDLAAKRHWEQRLEAAANQGLAKLQVVWDQLGVWKKHFEHMKNALKERAAEVDAERLRPQTAPMPVPDDFDGQEEIPF